MTHGAQSISTRRAYGVQRVCRVGTGPLQRVCEASGDPVPGAPTAPVGAAPERLGGPRSLPTGPFPMARAPTKSVGEVAG